MDRITNHELRITTAWLILLWGCGSPPNAEEAGREIILCGADEVFIVKQEGGEKVWSWKAAEHPELPEALRKRFGSTDDCKPVDGGKRILISSSGGAVALVERATGQVVFHAAALNSHSAERLPGNKIVVASSYNEAGNRLLIFDASTSDQVLASDALFGAHGVVWDDARRCLWALGEIELRRYRIDALESDHPTLTLLSKVDLPQKGGHDLRPMPDGRRLLVTAIPHVWFFDRESGSFEFHPLLGNEKDIKSVDVEPRTGRLMYVKAEEKFWAEHVRFLDPDASIELKGRRLYKARWAN